MSLVDALREVSRISGWDWSGSRVRTEPFGWDYVEVLRSFVSDDVRMLDVGTGGGEVFSRVARPPDVALDFSTDMLDVARTRLSCPLVCGDQHALPFGPGCFDVVADRHVGVEPAQVLRVLRPGGVYVTQQVGGRICQNIFDAFGWGTNEAFWQRELGDDFWPASRMARAYAEAGCEILRQGSAIVEQEFLDERSLAFWLLNAPLPEQVDPDRHADILDRLPLVTNWHAELLVVRM